jgi:hypothetical protein
MFTATSTVMPTDHAPNVAHTNHHAPTITITIYLYVRPEEGQSFACEPLQVGRIHLVEAVLWELGAEVVSHNVQDVVARRRRRGINRWGFWC